jgi:hypothetical protein
MRTYRYSWRRDFAEWAPDLSLVYIDVPSLCLKIEIARHKPGWYHWLRIRRGGEPFPLCMTAGTIRMVFAVIREFVEDDLMKKTTGLRT